MPTLVVKNFPEPLHASLRSRALQNHRSVTKEVVVMLEQALRAEPPKRAPVRLMPPIRLKTGPVTTEWIEAAIAEGRD